MMSLPANVRPREQEPTRKIILLWDSAPYRRASAVIDSVKDMVLRCSRYRVTARCGQNQCRSVDGKEFKHHAH